MTELIERMLQDIENTKQTAEKKGLKKAAINMLNRNISLEDIADITGLSIEEIKKCSGSQFDPTFAEKFVELESLILSAKENPEEYYYKYSYLQKESNLRIV